MHPTTTSRLPWAIVLWAGLTLSGAVYAAEGEGGPDPRVLELVDRAREQRRTGDFDGAIASLKTALGIQTAPWLIYSLGRVYEDAKRYDLARSHYELCVGADVDVETRTRAVDGLARLDKVGEHGRLVLQVTPADATVTIDGEPWTVDAAGVALTAGAHRVSISHPEHEPEERTVQVAGGQSIAVSVVLGPRRVAPPVEVVVPAPRAGFHAGPWPWVTLVGAGVVGGLGVVAYLDGESDWDEIESAPERGVFLTESEDAALRSSGRDKRTLGFVAMGVGGAMLVTSVILFVLDGPTEGVGWTPTLGGDGEGWAIGIAGQL